MLAGCSRMNFLSMRFFDRKTHNEVTLLVYEMYQNAKNGNLNYFRPFIKKSLVETAEMFYNTARRMRGEMPVEKIPIERMPSGEQIDFMTKGLMTELVDARIYRTYRRRAIRVADWILLDYSNYCPRRGISFVITLTLDKYGNIKLYHLHGTR